MAMLRCGNARQWQRTSQAPQRLGQDGFNASDELLGALDQMVKFLIHFGSSAYLSSANS